MINVLFSGNSGVFDGALTCMLSILKRSEPDDYNFYVLTMDLTRKSPNYTAISDSQIEFLNEILKTYSPNGKVIKIDVTDIYEKEFGYSPNEGCYCSPYTLLRLFADKAELPDKILYLDIDIMFNRDIHLLYDIDVEGYEYAAARDHYGKYLIQPNYINAGVLLFNMPMMKKTGIFEKARELIRTKKLVFADQSALIRSTTKKKMLPQKFNDQKFLHKHTVVRHFSKRLFWLPYPHTDNIKQWHVSKVHKVFKYYQFDDVLYEYIYLSRKFKEREIKD
ncbi:MAG: lipopolysaccharide biosynthesis protein [Clostridia bacterium]|nr:lipopolysaccharide biosynthesis protein [Clostridia bacterium]